MTEASSSEIRAAIDVYSGTYHRLISYAKFVALTVDLLLCQLSALSLKSGYEEWRCKSRYYVSAPRARAASAVARCGESSDVHSYFTPSLKSGRAATRTAYAGDGREGGRSG